MASLTLAQAEQVLAGAKAKVMELGVRMSVSVVDPRGDLVTMFRGDGAPWRTPAVSRAKARASACFGRSTHDLEGNAGSAVFTGVMAMEGGSHDSRTGRAADFPERRTHRCGGRKRGHWPARRRLL